MRSMNAIKALAACLAAATITLVPTAQADTFPSKPVTLVVGFGPGTGSDILGRLLGMRLEQVLGQTVVVENKAGAGGIIGSDAVAKAPPDGYTVLLGTNAMLITSPLLMPNPPYDMEKDFRPIGGVARTSMVMVTGTRPDSPKNLAELIERAKPGKASFASAGNGTIGHLTTELALKKLGLRATHVPYKGSGQSLNDVARGEVLFASDTPVAALPLIRNGLLRPIAVTGEHRFPSLPDTPTFIESGVPGVKLYAWWGLFVPARTPPAVIDTLSRSLAKVVADPQTRQQMANLELEPFPMSAGELATFARADHGVWRGFLEQADIKRP